MPTVTLASGIATTHAGFAAQGNEVHLVYEDAGSVRYRKSVDEGSAFTAAVTIGTTNELPPTSPIAVDGKYVHVVYARDSNNAAAPVKLYYARSQDGGATWDSEVTIDDGTGVANNRFPRVSVHARAGYVHIFWTTHDTATFVPDVLSYRRSTDNGGSFATEVSLASSTGAHRPEATLVENYLHLVWTDTREGSTGNGGETFYMRSDDRGATWGTAVNLSNTSENNTIRTTIAANGSWVVVAWQYPAGTPGSEDIIWRYSSDNGVTWSANATLVTGTGSQEHPSLGYQAGVVAISWTNQNDTPDRTYAKLSRDNGVTWSAAQVIYVPTNSTQGSVVSFTTRFLAVMDNDAAASGLKLTRSPVFERDPVMDVLIDDFNRADDATPPPGTNWTNGVTTFVGGEGIAIVSNQACRASTGGVRQGGYWNVGQFTNADFVADVSAGFAADGGLAVHGRLKEVADTTTDGYALDIARISGVFEWNLLRHDNVVSTNLTPLFARTLAANDKVTLSCRGDLIIGWHLPSGGEWTQVAAAVDGTYTTGYAGLEFLLDQTVKVTTLWGTELRARVPDPRPKFVYMRKNR